MKHVDLDGCGDSKRSNLLTACGVPAGPMMDVQVWPASRGLLWW